MCFTLFCVYNTPVSLKRKLAGVPCVSPGSLTRSVEGVPCVSHVLWQLDWVYAAQNGWHSACFAWCHLCADTSGVRNLSTGLSICIRSTRRSNTSSMGTEVASFDATSVSILLLLSVIQVDAIGVVIALVATYHGHISGLHDTIYVPITLSLALE